jgi:hypothetical protein
MHYTFVKRFGRSEPWPLGATLPRSSSTSVPLWMAILLLTETVLDVALARTYCTMFLLFSHLLLVQTVAYLA